MATPVSETSKVGKRGTFVIPAKLRNRFGLKEGSLVIAEETPEGILLRPAIAVPTTSLTQKQTEELLMGETGSSQLTDISQQNADAPHQAKQRAKKSK